MRRTAVPATQLFRFDALPPDFLRRPPALQVPLVCVPDIPAPRLTPTRPKLSTISFTSAFIGATYTILNLSKSTLP